MSDLYELTRRLVALGCPEPEGLEYDDWGGRKEWLIEVNAGDYYPLDCAAHARAIWEAHAREWAAKEKCVTCYYNGVWEIVSLRNGKEYHGHDLLSGIATVLE